MYDYQTVLKMGAVCVCVCVCSQLRRSDQMSWLHSRRHLHIILKEAGFKHKINPLHLLHYSICLHLRGPVRGSRLREIHFHHLSSDCW